MAPKYRIETGDCREVMASMPDASIDSIVTDPPYGLEFMGKDWDAPWKSDRRQVFDGTLQDDRENPFKRQRVRYGVGASYGGHVAQMQAFQEYMTAIFLECLRVLKPGGHLLSFGGTRTYHRMASAIEDAGFEIRDQIGWAYGTGFPKSHNQTGEFKGWGTALKPAWEPIALARKPLDGTVAETLQAHGTGALNIEGCRVEGDTKKRRWPANLIHDGSDDVLSSFPPAKMPAHSAARFFYCAKASKADRDDGLDHMPEQAYVQFQTANGTSGKPSSISAERNTTYRNIHPTVKPTALMRYLCRLVTPHDGTVLDPFMGSGSTGRGAMMEGFNFVGIEMNAEYVAIAEPRIAAALRRAEEERAKSIEAAAVAKMVKQLDMFSIWQ